MTALSSRREAGVFFLGGGEQSEKGSQMGRDGMTTEPPVVAEYRKGTEISRCFHRVARPM